MEIKFKYDLLLPLSELKDSLFQHNKHPPEQIKRLAKLMKDDGVRHPIHVSSLSNRICYGHGRKQAALLNGWDEFPIAYQKFDSPEEEYASVQSDNAIAGWAELDLASINADVPDLGPDFDIEMLGLENFTIDIAERDLDAEPGHKDIKKVTCPECGHVWDANFV